MTIKADIWGVGSIIGNLGTSSHAPSELTSAAASRACRNRIVTHHGRATPARPLPLAAQTNSSPRRTSPPTPTPLPCIAAPRCTHGAVRLSWATVACMGWPCRARQQRLGDMPQLIDTATADERRGLIQQVMRQIWLADGAIAGWEPAPNYVLLVEALAGAVDLVTSTGLEDVPPTSGLPSIPPHWNGFQLPRSQ